jgi:hypothetical protein
VVEDGRCEVAPAVLTEFVAEELRGLGPQMLAELIVRHRGAREADDVRARFEPLLAKRREERRDELSAGQIAGSAEDDDRR